MTSSNSNWIKNLLVGKPQEENTVVYRNLLNILEDPAVLVDNSSGTILNCNSEFNKFTAFSPVEIAAVSFKDIIELENAQQFSRKEAVPAELITRNKNRRTVFIRVFVLDELEHLYVYLIIPEQRYLEQQYSWQENLFKVTQSLLRLIESETLEEAFQKAVDEISEFFETGHVYIYQAKSEYPELGLSVSANPAHQFPLDISTHELRLDQSTTIWVPGQRMYTEIHKTARILNLTYVATSTMGPGKTASGLLVVGHEKTQPSKFIVAIMDVFSATLSSLFQYFVLVSNLRTKISKDEWKLTVQSEIINQIQDGIVVLNTDRSIWFLNPSAELMLGYQMREIIGHPIENILIGPDNLMPLLESSRQELYLQRLGIVQIHRRDGDSIPVELKIIPVIHRDELYALLIYLRDVSENEEFRVRAQQLEQRAILGEFLAVFAHEVRNPINNISMGLQMLSRTFADDPKNKDLVDRMNLDCERLTHQMEGILSYSKPFDPKFETIDAGVLVQRVVDRWKPRMMRVGVVDFVQKPEKLPEISADPRLLEQVFTNLISNAVEAMSQLPNGTLGIIIQEIQTISNHPQIEIKITDNGPGIPEEVAGRIFEPFITTKKTGTGLGLAISKRIITAHRGNISVESYPGGGTIFAVYLPVKQGEI